MRLAGGRSARARSAAQRLRGGGRGHPKATAEEYAAMEGVELTDQQALDLRRHWKKKPEWLEVTKQGVKKRGVRGRSVKDGGNVRGRAGPYPTGRSLSPDGGYLPDLAESHPRELPVLSIWCLPSRAGA